jgi:CRP-like cAMP-binding protein
MTELEKYINSYFEIDQEDLILLSSSFIPQTLKKGDFFLRTGRYCEKLSFIKSGLLRIYVSTEEREVTQWISTKGYFITDLSSLVFNVPSRWSIQALTDVELYTIKKEDYNQIGNIIPKWHLAEKFFIAKCFTMLEDRIFSHLSMTAEERYNFFFQQNKELFNQVPLQYIASMLGMTPETFSRIRRKAIS